MEDLFPVSLGEMVELSRETLAKAKERFKPVLTVALFSGGNDSTSMLHLVRNQIDAVVHIVTGIGIPETTDFVRKMCAEWQMKLIELHTDPQVYRDIVLTPRGQGKVWGKGFPGPALHFLTYHQLKQHRLRDLQRDYSKKGEKILLVSGRRRLESKRRNRKMKQEKRIKGPDHEVRRCAWANPIAFWSSHHLLDYREEYGVPQSPVAQLIHKSGECLCGAFAKKGELEEIEFWFPETGKYIRSLEVLAERAGKHYCRWGWGHEKLAGVPAPGPMCQSCTLFD